MHETIDPGTEVKRLQRCMNDLVSVLALPAVWSDCEPRRVVDTLLDALLVMLDLDLLYARVRSDSSEIPIDSLRTSKRNLTEQSHEEVMRALKLWFGQGSHKWPEQALRDIGQQEISVFPIKLGLNDELGFIVAGSLRAGFPEQTERLVLSVAANQAAIGLQQAQRLNEQKERASELHRQVAQRTAELAAINDELRKEIADRRHAEDGRKGSEEKYRLLVEAASDAIVSVDDNGSILFANPAVASAFGYEPIELIGQPLTVLMPETMREQHEGGFKRYLATGQRHINWQGAELTALRKNGEEFPIEISFGELTRDNHRIFTGFLRDISKRKQAERALRAAMDERTRISAFREEIGMALSHQEDLKAVLHNCARAVVRHLDAAFARIWILGGNGRELELQASAGMYTHLDGPHSRILVGQHKIGLIAQERKPHFTNEAQSDDRVSDKEWARRERMISFAGYPLVLEDRLVGVMGMFSQKPLTESTLEALSFAAGIIAQDIERRQAEEALRRSEAFLAEGQRLGQMGSYSWCVATDKIAWSNELYRIYEFETGVPVRPELIRNRVHPQDLSLYERMVENARNGGNDFEWQFRLMMPDQSIKYLHSVAHATRDQDGQLEYIAVVQDVTERRQSEEALHKSRSELAQMSRLTTMGEMAASIAHEVNQPLTAVTNNASGCLRLLANHNLERDVLRRALEEIVADGTRASAIIARIRAFIKKAPVEKIALDMNDVIQEVLVLVGRELEEHQVSIDRQLAADLPRLVADRVQLQQVLLNLIRNGIDAMASVANRSRLLCLQSRIDESGKVLVAVGDSGTGFGSDMDRVFAPFFTTKVNGMGMGLSISRSLVESHGGRLWAEPNSPHGAVLSFTLPVTSGSPS
jgi:PAS domain S-box-containing protein